MNDTLGIIFKPLKSLKEAANMTKVELQNHENDISHLKSSMDTVQIHICHLEDDMKTSIRNLVLM